MKPILTVSVLIAGLLVACSGKRIPGTDIQDNSDTRAIIAVIDAYRKAAERRDAQGVLALVSPSYFDDAGTSDPSDDLDYAQISKQLPEDYQKLAAVKLDLKVRQVTVEGDRAVAELMYDSHFRVSTPRGEIPKAASDVQQMVFKKEGGSWKIISGL